MYNDILSISKTIIECKSQSIKFHRLIQRTILLDVIFNAGLFFYQYNLIFFMSSESNSRTIITKGPGGFVPFYKVGPITFYHN
jgi:hypothetical protein